MEIAPIKITQSPTVNPPYFYQEMPDNDILSDSATLYIFSEIFSLHFLSKRNLLLEA